MIMKISAVACSLKQYKDVLARFSPSDAQDYSSYSVQVEINSIDDLLALTEQIGREIIIGKTYNEETFELEIYDGYRE